MILQNHQLVSFYHEVNRQLSTCETLVDIVLKYAFDPITAPPKMTKSVFTKKFHRFSNPLFFCLDFFDQGLNHEHSSFRVFRETYHRLAPEFRKLKGVKSTTFHLFLTFLDTRFQTSFGPQAQNLPTRCQSTAFHLKDIVSTTKPSILKPRTGKPTG